jgi:hypothetical protein
LALVGFIVLLLILLRYISISVVLSATERCQTKEVPMEKTLTAKSLVFFGSLYETIWAIGVSSVWFGPLSA